MNFRLLKYSFYSILASLFGTGVILPSWGCFNLHKKNQEIHELLKNKKEEIDESNKSLEEFRNKAIESRALTHEAGKQASRLKFQKLFLGVERSRTISRVKSLIEKIKQRNLDSRSRWDYYIHENNDIATDLEKVANEHQNFLNTIKHE